MFCTHCGAQVQDGTHFCGNCGAALESQEEFPTNPYRRQRKNRVDNGRSEHKAAQVLERAGPLNPRTRFSRKSKH